MAHATTTIGDVFALALTRHSRTLVHRLPGAFAGRTKAVHRARVTSRRLREVLATIAAAWPDLRAERVRKEVRRVTRALGPLREIDVAIHEFDRRPGREQWSPDSIAVVRARLERQRERRAAKVAAKGAKYDRAHLRDRCRDLASRLSAVRGDAPWWHALTTRVVRRAAGVRVAAAACGTLYAPEPLHALRIAIKKLRYALELVPDLGPDLRRALLVLKRAQRGFGQLHDVQMLLAEVRSVDAGRRTGQGAHGVDEIVDALDLECREIHAKLLTVIPAVSSRADEIAREVGARRRRRLVMAKASVRPAHGRQFDQSRPQVVSR